MAFKTYFDLVKHKAEFESDEPVKDAPEDMAGVIVNKFSDLCKYLAIILTFKKILEKCKDSRGMIWLKSTLEVFYGNWLFAVGRARCISQRNEPYNIYSYVSGWSVYPV